MKHLAYAALLTSLLAGCSEMPVKDASIEDRALSSDSAKPGAAVKVVEAGTPAAGKPDKTDRVAAPVAKPEVKPASGKPIAAKPADKVETRGVAVADAEVKSLDGSQPPAKADGKPGTAAGSAVQTGGDAAQTGGAPVLDPRNPASPVSKRRILFDYDSAAIRDEYRGLLESHAQYLRKEKTAKAILQGHADERGSREYNLALGQRRSESVYKALNLLGVPESQIEAVSFGEEKPVTEGHDEEAWMQNRRTEILYQGE
jgi:peptidoglycan-associated lipoprotein